MAEQIVRDDEPDFLNMSDEEMLNAAPPAPTSDDGGSAEVSAEKEHVSEVPKTDPEGSVDGDEDAGTAAEEAVKEPDRKLTKDVSADESEDKEVDKPAVETASVDFEAEYKRMLAPFKANGRDITVNSVDDAISLMQMGANYNKKMVGLKPNLKLMKMLENNGLLSEEKISWLIDLDKKSPDAINKLVKDSGLNPMDFDAEKASEYKPKIHTVDEREMELDTVLDELQSTPSYNRTLAIVSKEWDGPSKQVIAGSPQLLKVINSHVSAGIYDLISQEVERERVFGRLNGLSDIEAYRQVGDAIQLRGGFNHLGSPQEKSSSPVVVKPKPKAADDSSLNDKRRSAGSTRGAASSEAPPSFNPLAMSDEEFSKVAAPQYG